MQMLNDLMVLFRYIDWDKAGIHRSIVCVAVEYGLSYGDVAKMLRGVLFGGLNGPSLDAMVEVLGGDESIERLKNASNIATVKS